MLNVLSKKRDNPFSFKGLCLSSTIFLWLLLLASFLHAKPLQIWVNSPTDVQYYSKMVELYHQKNPTFKAEIKHYGFKELPDKLALSIKTGINPPDIVQIDELFFSLYLPNQIPFLDITKEFKESTLSATILPQRSQLFSYNSRQYGIPQSTSTVVLYYRHDLFQKYNIKPSELETWDQFVKVGLKQKKGESHLIALDWSYFSIIMHQRGFPIFDEQGSFLNKSLEVEETFIWLQNLLKYSIGIIPDRGHIFEPVFFQGDVKHNEVMTVIGAGWYGLDMIRSFSDTNHQKWRAMPLPRWDDKKSNTRRTSSFSGQGLFIYKNTKNPKKSWKFIEFVMKSLKANVLQYTMGNSLTANSSSWFDSHFYENSPFLNYQSLGRILINLSPQTPFIKQVPKRAIFYNLLRERFWQGLISIDKDYSTDKKELRKLLSNLKNIVEQYSY